ARVALGARRRRGLPDQDRRRAAVREGAVGDARLSQRAESVRRRGVLRHGRPGRARRRVAAHSRARDGGHQRRRQQGPPHRGGEPAARDGERRRRRGPRREEPDHGADRRRDRASRASRRSRVVQDADAALLPGAPGGPRDPGARALLRRAPFGALQEAARSRGAVRKDGQLMPVRRYLKRAIDAAFLPAVAPVGILWGREKKRGGMAFFVMGAQACALVPGLPGVFLRRAFYRLTLEACGESFFVGFGAWFSQRTSRIDEDVYVGPYAVL